MTSEHVQTNFNELKIKKKKKKDKCQQLQRYQIRFVQKWNVFRYYTSVVPLTYMPECQIIVGAQSGHTMIWCGQFWVNSKSLVRKIRTQQKKAYLKSEINRKSKCHLFVINLSFHRWQSGVCVSDTNPWMAKVIRKGQFVFIHFEMCLACARESRVRVCKHYIYERMTGHWYQ